MITIKTDSELTRIRAASRIVAKVLAEVGKLVAPGITTLELDSFAEKQIMSLGGEPAFKGYRGYQHATCLSVNEEVVHAIPSLRPLREGDILGVDVGVRVDGMHGDAARTFLVGKVSKRDERLVRVTYQALFQAIRQVRAGKRIGDVSFAIEKYAQRFGYSVVRDLFGHGIGGELHEDPLIPNFGVRGQGPLLQPGMVLAIEPMLNEGGHQIETLADGWTVVTVDRKRSAHFEHTVLVTEADPEILTEGVV